MARYVPGQGNPNARLMIIGEAPGYHEDLQGIPFVGDSGSILDKDLKSCGLSRSEVWTTNVLKYRPPENNLSRFDETGHTVEECLEELRNEINQIKPNVIFAIGNYALNHVASKDKITKWRGSILLSDYGIKVVASVHPANFLRPKEEGGLPYYYRYVFKHDLKRAVEESLSPTPNFQDKNILICKSSLQLHTYIQQHEDSPYVAIDIETIKSIPVCIAIAFNSQSAMSVPLLALKGVEIGELELNDIWQQLRRLFARKPVIGQNIKFDHRKMLSPCGIDFPAGVHCDTMFLAHTLHPELPKSLEFLTSIYSRVPYYKSEGKEFNIAKDHISKLFIYNGKDSVVTYEVMEVMLEIAKERGLTDFFFNHVMPLHPLYMEIDDCGLKVNFQERARLWSKYTAYDLYAGYEFEQLTGLISATAEEQKAIKRWEKKTKETHPPTINIGSPQQIKWLLFDHLQFPLRKKADEDTIVGLLGNHADTEAKQRILGLILDIRRYRKTKNTYIEAEPDYDGRMRTSYRVVGTENGRTATGILDSPVRPTPIGSPFQMLSKHGDIGPEIRGMYEVDDDCAYLEADLSQAEARIVALLSDDDRTLQLFDTVDIHSLTASWIFGKPIDEIDRETERFVGKTTRHAGNYGMGKHKHMVSVNSDARKFGIPVRLSEATAGRNLERFHANSPKIRKVFHKEIREHLQTGGRCLRNPYGRERQFLDRWGDDLVREALAFIPQSTVRDKMIQVMYAIKRSFPSVRIAIEAHDSITSIVPISLLVNYARVLIGFMEQPIDFKNCSLSRGSLVIPAEVKVSYKTLANKDFEKLKVA